jgi:catechol 2,3-dioxygenase-like lactoylglutathione lyase family enzyme
MQLDHLILAVNDIDASTRFFSDILGLACEGEAGPFRVIRVSPELTLQLAPWGTTGGQHLAFSMSPAEFDAVFARIRAGGLPYGDSYHDVGNSRGPGRELGSQGMGASLYLFDPNEHLIEIRQYDEAITAPV